MIRLGILATVRGKMMPEQVLPERNSSQDFSLSQMMSNAEKGSIAHSFL